MKTTLLSAVNVILPKMGENPVDSLDEPNSSVSVILPVLQTQLNLLLIDGWWFNRKQMLIHKNLVTNRYDLGDNVLVFVPDDPRQAKQFQQHLVHPVTGLEQDVQGPVPGLAIIDLDFEDIPEPAKILVMYSTGLQVLEDSLDKASMQQWERGAAKALDSLTFAETRINQYVERAARNESRSIIGNDGFHNVGGNWFRVV